MHYLLESLKKNSLEYFIAIADQILVHLEALFFKILSNFFSGEWSLFFYEKNDADMLKSDE